MSGTVHDAGISRLELSTSVYSLEAIKKAAYKMADRASVIISPASASTVTVTFTFGPAQSTIDRQQVITDFSNELLDQDLREIIKREAGPLRNLILAHAFSKTTLADKS